MIYFWRFMCWLDVQLHRLDDYPWLGWLTDTEWRCNFCQWAWYGWASEDQADVIDTIAKREEA